MKIVKKILWGLFDFFCGDWWNLLGVAVAVVLLEFADAGSIPFLAEINYWFFPIIVFLTMMLALHMAVKKIETAEKEEAQSEAA